MFRRWQTLERAWPIAVLVSCLLAGCGGGAATIPEITHLSKGVVIPKLVASPSESAETATNSAEAKPAATDSEE